MANIDDLLAEAKKAKELEESKRNKVLEKQKNLQEQRTIVEEKRREEIKENKDKILNNQTYKDEYEKFIDSINRINEINMKLISNESTQSYNIMIDTPFGGSLVYVSNYHDHLTNTDSVTITARQDLRLPMNMYKERTALSNKVLSRKCFIGENRSSQPRDGLLNIVKGAIEDKLNEGYEFNDSISELPMECILDENYKVKKEVLFINDNVDRIIRCMEKYAERKINADLRQHYQNIYMLDAELNELDNLESKYLNDSDVQTLRKPADVVDKVKQLEDELINKTK